MTTYSTAARTAAPSTLDADLMRLRDALPALNRARRATPPLPTYPSAEAVIEHLKPSEPVFCISAATLRTAAQRFASFPGRVLYAVKCNPHPFVLNTLYQAGIVDFDVASLDEIRLIDSLFGKSAGQFFNNPAKTRPAIAAASREFGVRFFTVDCEEEIDKVMGEAEPSSDLILAVRLATPPRDARYALSTKFGASPADAARLLRIIDARGVRTGLSFHVGSQCLSAEAFETAIALAGKVLAKSGVSPSVLNVGGGFPAPYPGDNPETIDHYFGAIIHGRRSLKLPPGCMLMCEPGRNLVAEAGTLVTQVVMRRGNSVFLNDGVFGTLQELAHPKEKRPLRVYRDARPVSSRRAEFKVYGPTCDSNDVLGAPMLLPADVREGDHVVVDMMGAYSLSMRTRFNGFHTDTIVSLG